VEAFTAAPIILLNGEQIFPAQVEAIRGARHTITYAQYYYEDGLVARDIAAELAVRSSTWSCTNGRWPGSSSKSSPTT